MVGVVTLVASLVFSLANAPRRRPHRAVRGPRLAEC